MIKFLYSTDWHAKGKSPSTRTDDYPSTIEAKITHFFQLGHELGVDAYLGGGDYFDSPYTSAEYVTRIGKIISKELRDKTLYGVWGNHDLIGWNPNTIKRTAHGVFAEFCENFRILEREPMTFTAKNGQSIKLSGVSSYAQLDRHIIDEVSGDIIHHRSRDWVVDHDGIHIVHGYLSPKPILDDIPHTVIEEMKHTKARVTLGAHEHTGFAVTETDNGLVCNPGALGRVFASHAEMNRMPKYLLVKIHDDGTQAIEPIQCPIAKEGHEVMDRSVLDAKKAKEAMLKEAKGSIREVLKGMSIEGVDLHQIMSRYKDTTKPAVFNEAKRRLGL